MADITETQIIRFCNSFIRPVSNNLVGVAAVIDIETVTWTDTVLPSLSGYDDDDIVADDSAIDGTSRLTKKDIVDFVSALAAIKAVFDAPGATAVISKPHYTIKLP